MPTIWMTNMSYYFITSIFQHSVRNRDCLVTFQLTSPQLQRCCRKPHYVEVSIGQLLLHLFQHHVEVGDLQFGHFPQMLPGEVVWKKTCCPVWPSLLVQDKYPDHFHEFKIVHTKIQLMWGLPFWNINESETQDWLLKNTTKVISVK